MKTYEHETDRPSLPKEGRMEKGMGMESFKGDCDPIAYGQAAKSGMASDKSKISSQMKQYHWD